MSFNTVRAKHRSFSRMQEKGGGGKKRGKGKYADAGFLEEFARSELLDQEGEGGGGGGGEEKKKETGGR